jgi:hypothetical protein
MLLLLNEAAQANRRAVADAASLRGKSRGKSEGLVKKRN